MPLNKEAKSTMLNIQFTLKMMSSAAYSARMEMVKKFSDDYPLQDFQELVEITNYTMVWFGFDWSSNPFILRPQSSTLGITAQGRSVGH